MVRDKCVGGMDNIIFPYGGVATHVSPFRVVSGKGCFLELEGGKSLLDGISSWWTMCHGYSHPYIVEKMTKQLNILPHVMFCHDLVHDQALVLAGR